MAWYSSYSQSSKKGFLGDSKAPKSYYPGPGRGLIGGLVYQHLLVPQGLVLCGNFLDQSYQTLRYLEFGWLFHWHSVLSSCFQPGIPPQRCSWHLVMNFWTLEIQKGILLQPGILTVPFLVKGSHPWTSQDSEGTWRQWWCPKHELLLSPMSYCGV